MRRQPFSMYAATRCFAIALSIAAINLSAEEPAKWRAHDITRPRPAVVTPPAAPGQPPADAIILFAGKNLDHFESLDGTASKWKLADGCMMPTPHSGPHRTKQLFGDIQLHVDWSSPQPAKGKSQGRGNSGIYFMSKYEVQVLDSFENETYADGQAAAMYGQNPPLVNVCRPPGEWQTYDIVFRRPHFNEAGELTSPASMTVFHNGVVVQDNFELWGPTNWLKHDPYQVHDGKLPLMLQDHGNPVRFRNLWVRELPPRPTATALAHAQPQLDIDPATLDRYVGQYDNIRVRRSEEDLQLLLHGRWFDLVPQSTTRFDFLRTHASAEFLLRDESVTGMHLTLMGHSETKSRKDRKMEDRPAKQAANMDAYLGMTEEAAIAKAKAEGRRCRIVKRDDESFPMTRDYRPNRVNLTIKDGVVTVANGG